MLFLFTLLQQALYTILQTSPAGGVCRSPIDTRLSSPQSIPRHAKDYRSSVARIHGGWNGNARGEETCGEALLHGVSL